MTSVILFVFGAIVGSFLNVVALRYHSGRSLQGRSACGACGEKLQWFELVPILSFLFLWGRCRHCGGRISPQYPLVELWTGLLFASLPYALLLPFCLYVVITVYDLRHKIIPDALVYFSLLPALIIAIYSHYSLLDWFSGPILFAFFALLWVLTRGRAIGFGDAKLTLSIGLLLGARVGFSAIVLSFWLGAAWGLSLILTSILSPLFRGSSGLIMKGRSRVTMRSEIPFAPFLVLAAWAAVVLQLDLLHVSIFFQ